MVWTENLIEATIDDEESLFCAVSRKGKHARARAVDTAITLEMYKVRLVDVKLLLLD